jgi:hypothetical protein
MNHESRSSCADVVYCLGDTDEYLSLILHFFFSIIFVQKPIQTTHFLVYIYIYFFHYTTIFLHFIINIYVQRQIMLVLIPAILRIGLIFASFGAIIGNAVVSDNEDNPNDNNTNTEHTLANSYACGLGQCV